MKLPTPTKVGSLLNIGGGPLLLGTFLIWVSYQRRAGAYWGFFSGSPAPAPASGASGPAAPVPAAAPNAAGGASSVPSATQAAPNMMDTILQGLLAQSTAGITST